MRLHTITGRARKCGPTALSAITGRPSHECAALIRAETLRPRVSAAIRKEGTTMH